MAHTFKSSKSRKIITGMPQYGTDSWQHAQQTRDSAGSAPRTDTVTLASDNVHMWRTYVTVTEAQLPRANRANTSAEITVRRTLVAPVNDTVSTSTTVKRSRKNGPMTVTKLS